MLYVIGLLLIILCCLKKDSKLLFISTLLFMWVLFAFSGENADTEVYYSRFYNYESLEAITEPGFNLVMLIFNKLHFTYQQFLMLFSLIFVFVVGYFIKKNTPNYALALILYFIFPFSIDIVQVRNSLGFLFIILAFKYLLSDDKFSSLKYFFFILLAASFHLSAIFFLVFVVIKRISIKQTIVLTILIIMLSLFILEFGILENLNTYLSGIWRFESIIDRMRLHDYNLQDILKITLKSLIALSLFLVVFYFTIINIKRSKLDLNEKNHRLRFIYTLIKLNILVMIILPFYQISLDLYRLQRILYLFNFVGFTLYNFKTNTIESKTDRLLYMSMIIVVASIIWYIQLYIILGDFERVFRAVFENNILF